MNGSVEKKNLAGLTPVRTARLVASLVAFMGMFFLLIQRVLATVLLMANDGIRMGLARYNNFTGRFAAQNFAEDKQLLNLLKEVQSIMPAASTALTVLMVVSVVFLVIAVLGLALPRQFAHVLVALKLLKWADSADDSAAESGSLQEALTKLGNIPLKKLAIPFAVIVVVCIGCFAVSSCREKARESLTAGSVEEMQQQALAYIVAQKEYFSKNKSVGNVRALQLPDSLADGTFEYKITPSRFVAVSVVPLGNCPAGSKWSISATVKGVFNKELSLYPAVPKDSSCAALTPDYKNLGRKGTAPSQQN